MKKEEGGGYVFFGEEYLEFHLKLRFLGYDKKVIHVRFL